MRPSQQMERTPSTLTANQTLRLCGLSPGDQLKITYINDLPAKPEESCAIAPCMDMTNLHFHGLTVSPDAPRTTS